MVFPRINKDFLEELESKRLRDASQQEKEKIRSFRKSSDKPINFVKLNRDIIFPVQAPKTESQGSLGDLKFNGALASERLQRQMDYSSINEQLKLRISRPTLGKSRGSLPQTERRQSPRRGEQFSTVVVQGEHVSSQKYVHRNPYGKTSYALPKMTNVTGESRSLNTRKTAAATDVDGQLASYLVTKNRK